MKGGPGSCRSSYPLAHRAAPPGPPMSAPEAGRIGSTGGPARPHNLPSKACVVNHSCCFRCWAVTHWTGGPGPSRCSCAHTVPSPAFRDTKPGIVAVPSKAFMSPLSFGSCPPAVSSSSQLTPPFSAPGLVLSLLFLNPVATGSCSGDDQQLLKQLEHQADFMQDTSTLLDPYVSTRPWWCLSLRELGG